MSYSNEKMQEFVALLDKYTPKDGGVDIHEAAHFATYRETKPQGKCSSIYHPAILILAQGSKKCLMNGQVFDYSAGNYLTVLLPMPVEVDIVKVSPEKPLLMMGLKMDLHKIANLLVKIDQVQPMHNQSPLTDVKNLSGIFTRPMSDGLLDAVIRLLRTLDNPLEQAVLGEAILEEIYFRLICDDHTGALPQLLKHHGQVQQIAKVINHIQSHLDEVVSVEKLASMVNMSTSGFRKTFRQVMHMPPLQYAKLLKLDHAQTLIREGKNASEAGYMVGYNSPAQFSREYKRHFGFAPSAT